MASHHSQSLSDPNYLLRLQNMRLTEDAANNPLQVSHRRTSSLNGTVDNDIGLINKVPMPNLNRVPIDDDYKLYDENKFITASKLTGPKAQSPKHQMNVVKTAAANRNNSSSTHSVYENILYYNPSIPVTQQPLPPPPPAYSHYVSNASKTGISSGTYEVIGSRIQSNGSSLNRFTHTPQPDDSDPSHIYENLGNVSARASSEVPPPLPAKPKQSVYAQIGGDTSGTYVQPQSILPPTYRQQQSPTHAAITTKTYGNIDTVGAVKLQYSSARASVGNQSVPGNFEHQKHPSYLSKLQNPEALQSFPGALNVAMNPNYIEDLNGSDYVCMTRSTPQSVSKLTSLNPISVNQSINLGASPTNNSSAVNISTAMQLTSKNLQTLQQEQLNATQRTLM